MSSILVWPLGDCFYEQLKFMNTHENPMCLKNTHVTYHHAPNTSISKWHIGTTTESLVPH